MLHINKNSHNIYILLAVIFEKNFFFIYLNKKKLFYQYILYSNTFFLLHYIYSSLFSFKLLLLDVIGFNNNNVGRDTLKLPKTNILLLFRNLLPNSLIAISIFNKYNYFGSIESIFLNSNWLLRELKEFFNVFIFNLKDTRNLLYEYGLNNNLLEISKPLNNNYGLIRDLNTLYLVKKNHNFIELFMFKNWILLLLFIIIFLLFIFIFFVNNIFFIFLIIELLWIFIYIFCAYITIITNNSFFILFGLLCLLLGVSEIIVGSLFFFINKKNLL